MSSRNDLLICYTVSDVSVRLITKMILIKLVVKLTQSLWLKLLKFFPSLFQSTTDSIRLVNFIIVKSNSCLLRSTVAHSIPPVSTYVDNCISSVECDELSNTLDSLTSFKKERWRSTIKFGEKYSFNGSREDSYCRVSSLYQDSSGPVYVPRNLPPLTLV